MKNRLMVTLGVVLLAGTSSYAIDAKYRQLLERSGCTQVSEMQGCDIHKSKAENAKAGFGTQTSTQNTQVSSSPYSGTYKAIGPTGLLVATISIDAKEHVKVNGKAVKASRSDGALVFKQGFITYTIQGDPHLKNENSWYDSDAKTEGPIHTK